MADLFAQDGDVHGEEGARPLADILRPNELGAVIGQDHLLGEHGSLRRMLDAGRLGSLILWGPPGSGKTTVARLLAEQVDFEFLQISAVFSGVADLKKAFDHARLVRKAGKQVLLFVDEIHRFNRAQQDGFLPVMEDGTIVLIGATTENPSFELNSALLSRAQVLRFNPLDDPALQQLLERAQAHLGVELELDDEARQTLLTMADGDGRAMLGMVEDLIALHEGNGAITVKSLTALLQRRAPIYDKGADGHYNLISALHKTVRGSDPDAALYYFARMLDAGEDPLYIARRLIRMASEDIGMADPQALPQTIAAKESFEILGSPEGELALAQAVIYLATAPKSNAAYTAYKASRQLVSKTGSITPPLHILNAPTRLMEEAGYGDGYVYDHDTAHGFSGQEYFPAELGRQSFYQPVERGFERDIQKRMEFFTRLRNATSQQQGEPDDG